MSRCVRTDAAWCLLSAGIPAYTTAKTRAYCPLRGNKAGWHD